MWDDPLITIFVVFVFIFSLAWVINNKNSTIDAPKQPNDDKSYLKNGTIVGFGVEYTNDETFHYTPSANPPQNSDFKQEHQDIVGLTRALVKWTAILAIVTAIGGVFLYGQYRELRRASEDTKKAIEATNRLANEAKRSADIAKRTAERQLRAYIGVVDGDLRCKTCDDIRDGKIKDAPPGTRNSDIFFIYVRNGGRTPAYDLSVRFIPAEMPYGMQLPKNFSYSEDSVYFANTPAVSHATINPDERNAVSILLEPNWIMMFVRAQNKQSTLFIYGHVSYKDIFNRSQSIPFCIEYDPFAFLPSERYVACADHNTPKPDYEDDQ